MLEFPSVFDIPLADGPAAARKETLAISAKGQCGCTIDIAVPQTQGPQAGHGAGGQGIAGQIALPFFRVAGGCAVVSRFSPGCSFAEVSCQMATCSQGQAACG